MLMSISTPLDTHNSSLAEWVARAIDLAGVALHTQLRENNLHIICESSQCPKAAIVVPKLLLALIAANRADGFPTNPEQPIYQVILYGRAARSPVLEWIETIDIERLDRLLLQWLPPGVSLAAVSETPLDHTAMAATPLSTMHGDRLTLSAPAPLSSTEAIAQQVAEILSFVGSTDRIFIQNLPTSEKAGNPIPRPSLSKQHSEKQRIVFSGNCDSCPEESEIAEYIATKLRNLQLTSFSDAAIRFHIKGSQTDWVLRVDLTPPEEMLSDWARWGDVQAIAHILSQTLAAQGIQVRAELKDLTLHLFCNLSQDLTFDKSTTISLIHSKLEHLAPQSIQAAIIYGVKASSHASPAPESPVWIEWLNLPALAKHPDRTPSPITLAQQGDLHALTFLLQLALNPNLNQRLTTGGIHITIRHKKDLLHILTEAPICPQQSQVTQAIAELLQDLKIPEIAGVRVYGRRAGESSSKWSYAIDFVNRKQESERLQGKVRNFIPQPHPANLFPFALKYNIDRACELLQQWLCSTHLFIPTTIKQEKTTISSASTKNYSTSKTVQLACIWGTAGLLLTIQADWLLGQLLQLPSSNNQSSVTETQDRSALQPKEATDNSQSAPVTIASQFNNPSFNNPLLDEKLTLYKQACSTYGPPDILIVGSSRALRGIDPHALNAALATQGFTNAKIFNFGINGATAQVVDLLIRRILTPSQLPKLIIWADGARAFNSGRVDITYNAIAASLRSDQLNTNTKTKSTSTLATTAAPQTSETPQTEKPHKESNYEALNQSLNQKLAKVSSTYPSRDRLLTLLQQQYTRLIATTELRHNSDANIDLDGFLPLSIRFQPTTYYQHHPIVSGDYDSDYESFHLDGDQSTATAELISFVGLHQIPLVFVNLPLTNDYLDRGRKEYETQFQLYMQQLVSQKKLIFIDLSQMWPATYDYFSDPSHLNRYGASALSNHLAQQIIPWMIK